MTELSEMVNVRYMVDDVDEAMAFYTKFLAFKVLTSFPPAFADVARGNLRLLLSVPGGTGGGGAALSDGSIPEPGGWNRFAIQVADIEGAIADLRAKGAGFRGDIVSGVGVKQALLEDPDHNLVELYQPLAAYHERARPA